MKKRHLFQGIVAGLLVVATVIGAMELHRRQVEDVEVVIGGPFTMTAHDGTRVTHDDLAGRRSLVFFGFTYCPDICPTTLVQVAAWLDAMADKGDLIDAYFVTVDPERDSLERMAEYVTYFSDRITGLVGTADELRQMADSYRLYYARIDLDDGTYTMDHTAAIYLMDAEGRFFDAITMTASFDEAVAKLTRLVEEG
ncbi:MAG: SCO family protein [bacterium]|nr:SCO family protein [bacterium]MDE0240025.1 SCO family protein [bacterium]